MNTHEFLPLTAADLSNEFIGTRMPYKIRMEYQDEAHAWLEEDAQFESEWFSILEESNIHYEYYYFVDKSQAIRFMLTWS